MLLTNLVGACGALLSSIMFLPQAINMWKLRKNPEALRGISLTSYFAALGNAVIWLWYAWLTKAYWSGAPSLVNIPIILSVIIFKTKAGNQ